MHGMENLVFGQIGEARLGESPRGYNNVDLEWEGLKDKISMELQRDRQRLVEDRGTPTFGSCRGGATKGGKARGCD